MSESIAVAYGGNGNPDNVSIGVPPDQSGRQAPDMNVRRLSGS
jgi:hypothetical protein